MNNQITEEHQAVQISQLYTGLYLQTAPQQGNSGESKPRRRRKKNRGSSESEAAAAAAKKRKLTAQQVHLLETNFGSEHKLESERKDRLASELGLDPRQVAVWFQNRRARWKNKKLEEEYSHLKKLHESVVVEKCRLETEILKLKEQLSEAEKEKERLMRADGPLSSSSPSPSMSMEAVDPTSYSYSCLGEFGSYELEDVFYYMPEAEPESDNACIYGMEMEWPNPYI